MKKLLFMLGLFALINTAQAQETNTTQLTRDALIQKLDLPEEFGIIAPQLIQPKRLDSVAVQFSLKRNGRVDKNTIVFVHETFWNIQSVFLRSPEHCSPAQRARSQFPANNPGF